LRMTEKVSGDNTFFHSSSERLIGDSGVFMRRVLAAGASVRVWNLF
jgi:hypothetical protein